MFSKLTKQTFSPDLGHGYSAVNHDPLSPVHRHRAQHHLLMKSPTQIAFEVETHSERPLVSTFPIHPPPAHRSCLKAPARTGVGLRPIRINLGLLVSSPSPSPLPFWPISRFSAHTAHGPVSVGLHGRPRESITGRQIGPTACVCRR